MFTLSDGVGIANRDFFAPYAELVGRRLTDGADAGSRWRWPPVSSAPPACGPGDNDVNPASVRYMLRRGTYSNAKARRLLGWEPAVSVEEGLVRTVDWLHANGF